jgi:hypothetical protein
MAGLDYRVMDTQIFELGLSVYANSAYIVACSLVNDGLPATFGNLLARWTVERGLLDSALSDLISWRVLEPGRSPEGEPLFVPNPASLWRVPGTAP